MKNRQKYVLIIFLCGFYTTMGCVNTTTKKSIEQVKLQSKFMIPEVPTSIAIDKREEFLAIHYWDHFNFSDTTLTKDINMTRRAIADFIMMIQYLPQTTVEKSIHTMFSKASVNIDMYRYFTTEFENYLYNPHSSLYNENLYIITLQEVLANNEFSETEKIRSTHQLEMLSKNQIGEKATLFPELSKAKGHYIVLVFSNNDCLDCKRVKEYIQKEKMDEKATIIMVDCDRNEYLKKLYDLRAIPTLYLLSSERIIILKNTVIQKINEELDSYSVIK